MPSTGPTVFAGAPSVITQISLESEAFRVAALNPARAAGSTRPTGSPAPGMTDWGPARWRLVSSSEGGHLGAGGLA